MKVPKILSSFMWGQFANLFKLAIWWTALAPLTFALLRSTAAIGVGRIVYNTALCIFSPLSGSVIERVHPRTLLLRAATVRFVIYCVVLPAAWALLGTQLVLGESSTLALYIVLNVCLFIDGIAVAWSSILDIDMAGIDISSGVFQLDVSDEMRAYFNTRQEFFFAMCFIVFAPGLAFGGLAIHHYYFEHVSNTDTRISSSEAEAGTLVCIFGAAFLIGTFFQWVNLRKMTDEINAKDKEANLDHHEGGGGIQQEDEGGAEGSAAGGAEAGAEGEAGSLVATVCGEIKGALIVLKDNPHILFRLMFLGLEIAFEDAIIVVIAANMGIQCRWLGNGDAVYGNIWASVGVGSGKLGGALASLLMMKYYEPPKEAKKFRHLFVLVFFSTLITVMFPLLEMAHHSGDLNLWETRGIWLGAFFFYFFLSTLPKLGLMGLLQSMVSEVENGPRVFGFIAILVTIFDGVVIMSLSAVFAVVGSGDLSLTNALWAASGAYLFHGVLELLLGPTLILGPLVKAQAQQVSGNIEGGGASTTEQTPLVGANSDGDFPTKGSFLGGDAATGTFTESSAAVPIGGAAGRRGGSTLAPQEAVSTGSVPVAIMGTSATGVRVGSVARKSSTLGGGESHPSAAQGGMGSPKLGPPGPGYARTGSLLTPRSPYEN